jgi:hypothetical protein
MNPRKREAVVNALKRKGFEPSNTDHVRLQYFNTAGRKTRVWTKASHGGKHREISVSNLSKMAKQCKLSNHDFERLIDCPLSRDGYEDMLITADEIAAVNDN